MSYSKRFTRQITVHYSGSVSYPASEHGGTKSYSGTATEDVIVDIEVDTDAFDASVNHCNDTVNGLTASVGAMNAAQCMAISKNADKVSKTIIDGFFHTVRTDLSTQQAELEQAVTARLGLLREQSRLLHQKKEEMEINYKKTCEAYSKTFKDLNEELSNNVHKLDEDVFKFVNTVGQQSSRMLHTDLVPDVVMLGKENSSAEATLGVATVKQHALQALQQAQNFLISKARSEQTMRETVVEGTGNDRYFVPVCCLETTDEHRQAQRKCVLPEQYSSMQERVADNMNAEFFDHPSKPMDEQDKMQLHSYMQEEIANRLTDSSPHATRVRELINKMFNDLVHTL